MNRHLKNWLDGISQALTPYSNRDYVRPQRGDFRRDAAALRGDAAKVANDLRRNLGKNAKASSRLDP